MFSRFFRPAMLVVVFASVAFSGSAFAWGDEGHKIIGAIAYARLEPAAKAKVDAILAGDDDPLTARDFVSRTTWADRFRDSDRFDSKQHYLKTRVWHFVDIELDGGSIDAACRAAALPLDVPASEGPANDCVVRKVEQFAAELRHKNLPVAEQRLALKFLMHFVGDEHQPLHAADHQDKGGNAVPVMYAGVAAPSNLHAYWDVRLVAKLGRNASKVGAMLNHEITSKQAREWSAGTPSQWAEQSFLAARKTVYDFHDQRHVDIGGIDGLRLDADYDARSMPVVREQLSKAGVRLAGLLNATFR